MAYTEEEERALREFKLAGEALQRSAASRQASGQETRYGQAYQKLVRLGLRPQIRFKYRRPKSS